jgi:DNA mismatch repair protein MutL
MPGQPPTIRQLPEAVANQIAAGEVVERPAAVVKELCENALDAGASRITVRIEDGGRRLVAVADDGHGMRKDDLALALARHATSKLSSSEDLFRIATLGFRGEALPSIAAVSEFSIASRAHDQEGGWRLAVASSRVLPPEPYAMACGTQLEVRNLFWNVPARLKFLKSEAAESGQVTDQLMRLALSHPRVAFRLDAVQAEAERTLIDLPAGQTLGDRVRALFGRALSERLIAIAAGSGVMQITGFIAHPQEARPTAKRQYLFLNGRFVRDRLLFAAVREGF